MRCSLRTLILVLLIGGPVGAYSIKFREMMRHRPVPIRRVVKPPAPAPLVNHAFTPVPCGQALMAEMEEEAQRQHKLDRANEPREIVLFHLSPDEPVPEFEQDER